MDRAETIDETADRIHSAGGQATALRVDHTNESEVKELADRIRSESGRLDILVNSIWGADPLVQWGSSFWEIDVAEIQPFINQTVLSHVVTNRHLVPLMVEADSGLIVEMIDGHMQGYRGQILYDMVKAALGRLAYGMAMELVGKGVTSLALSPGFLRSEAVLEHFGVSEDNWRDAVSKDPYFGESESPLLTGRALVALASDPSVKQKAGQMLFASDLAREYKFADYDGRVPDFHGLFDQKVCEMMAAPLDDVARYYLWARYCQIHQETRYGELAQELAAALELEELGPALGPR